MLRTVCHLDNFVCIFFWFCSKEKQAVVGHGGDEDSNWVSEGSQQLAPVGVVPMASDRWLRPTWTVVSLGEVGAANCGQYPGWSPLYAVNAAIVFEDGPVQLGSQEVTFS